MPELRRLARELFDRPLVPAPPLEDVAARAAAYRQRRQVRLTASAVVCVLVLSAVVLPNIGDDDGSRLRTASDGVIDDIGLPDGIPPTDDLPVVGSTTTTTSTSPTTHPPGTTTTTTRPGGGGGQPDPCPGGQNAGATDVGVSGAQIKVVAIGAGPGVDAVVHKVNREGGICGRLLNLSKVPRGTAVDTKQFFAVLPEVAGAAEDAPGVPAVGTDGMTEAEYRLPWVWPVGTPAAIQAHTIVGWSWRSEAASRTFGIVYSQERYGSEANASLQAEVQKLGGTLKAAIAVQPGRASYAQEANQLGDLCGCDTVVFALDAASLGAFIRDMPDQDGAKRGFGTVGTHALSPAVSERFARDCGPACDRMYLWSPYVPPVGEYRDIPDVAAYVNDVRSVDPAVDLVSESVERGYVGAQVLVAGLRSVGANLTRERLQSALEAMTYRSGLVAHDLRWEGDRVANRSAVPIQIRTGAGGFTGFATVRP